MNIPIEQLNTEQTAVDFIVGSNVELNNAKTDIKVISPLPNYVRNYIGERLIDKHDIVSNLPEIIPYIDDISSSEAEVTIAVADIFPSAHQAKNAVIAMQRHGLDSDQIAIVARDYRSLEASANWENIAASGTFLAKILTELGISDRATLQFVEAVEKGEFLVITTGSNWEVSKAQHVLDNIGNWQFTEYFKSILTLPK